ncbi:MAG: glycosyltransferase [Coriobacteriia bacterium]
MTRDERADAPLDIVFLSNMYPSADDPAVGVFVRRQAEALIRTGARLRLAVNRDQRRGALPALVKYPRLMLKAILATLGGADVVVGHYLYPTAIIARMTAFVALCPYVLIVHGTDVTSVARGGVLGRAARAAVESAALVVCVSDALESRLRSELDLPPELPTAVVHMGVDLSVFRPDPEARTQLGWDRSERVVLFVGNPIEPKGIDILLTAAATLFSEGTADRLVIVGHHPLNPEPMAMAEALGIADKVEFTGRGPAEHVAVRMAAANVFVLPSRVEGLGLVLLEAMACGTPCVGTRVGGIPEALATPGCGRLVEPEDPAALAAAITEVLTIGKASFTVACMETAAAQGTDVQAHRFLEEVRAALAARASTR